MRRSIATGLPFAGLLAGFLVLSARRLADPDLPWHLALGRVMLEERRIPRIDPLAYTHRPIGHMEVASDTLLYLIERSGGALALQLFGALLAVGTALVLARAAERAGPARWGVIGFALAAMSAFFLVRPATISFVLMPLTLVLVGMHRATPEERRGKVALACLVPLVFSWVNLHGFAVLGLAVIGLYATYRSACRIAGGRAGAFLPQKDGTQLGATWRITAAAFLVSGANVAGYRLLTAPLQASRDFSRITEWATTTLDFLLTKEPFAAGFFVIALVALALGREPDGTRTPNGFDLGLFLLAAVLARSAVRMIPIAVILVTPTVAHRLASLVNGRRALELGSLGLPLAFAGAVFLSTSSFGIGFDSAQFPEGAVRFVQGQKPRGRMYNFMPYGGYLSYRLYPEHLVLVDGRTGWVHDPVLLERIFRSGNDPGVLAELTAELELEWAVTRSREGERFGASLATSGKWTMVYFDDTAAMYVRRNGSNAELAKRGYQALNHLIPVEKVLEAALSGRVPADALAHDGDLASLQDPASPRAAFLAGCGALATRDAPKLARAEARLAAVAPGHPALLVLASSAKSRGMR